MTVLNLLQDALDALIPLGRDDSACDARGYIIAARRELEGQTGVCCQQYERCAERCAPRADYWRNRALATDKDRLTAALHAIMRLADQCKEPCGQDPESAAAIRNGKFATIAQIAAQGLGLMRGPAFAEYAPQRQEDASEHGQLHPDRARSTARTALGYAAAFDGKDIDWHNDEPWPHRIELAQALDWITDLGAMVLNLADRVAAAPSPQAQAQQGLTDEQFDWIGQLVSMAAITDADAARSVADKLDASFRASTAAATPAK